jgi:probable F420-dependent oxidoreductase
MKFLYYFPGKQVPMEPSLQTIDAYASLAKAAAHAGFAGVAVDEHPIPSEEWRQGRGGHDCLDPFIALAVVAATEPQLELLTYLAVVPFRNPLMLAKQAATLDVMSGGRLLFGVGTGYQPLEFEALGVDFDERNALFDEGLHVIKLAWSGEVVNYSGVGFRARSVRALPTPCRVPHPPIWIGGNSKLTIRRVVDEGQGWMPMPNPRSKTAVGRGVPLETAGDLAALKRYLDEYADARGRTEPIDIVHSLALAPTDPAALVDHLAELKQIGVTWVCVNGQGADISEAVEWIEGFGASVISTVNPAL